MSWHVLPDDDWIAHEPNDSCPCGPQLQVVDGVEMMVHETLEGRADE